MQCVACSVAGHWCVHANRSMFDQSKISMRAQTCTREPPFTMFSPGKTSASLWSASESLVFVLCPVAVGFLRQLWVGWILPLSTPCMTYDSSTKKAMFLALLECVAVNAVVIPTQSNTITGRANGHAAMRVIPLRTVHAPPVAHPCHSCAIITGLHRALSARNTFWERLGGD